jgi:hypothetical protein
MADPRAYISYDYDNNETEKMLFSGQAKNSKTPFAIQDWSQKSLLPQSQWEALAKDKISKCNMLIVLVGKRTAYATGVVKEIAMAKLCNVPVFGVYVGGANTETDLPAGLQRNRTISWGWDDIAGAISQMMIEGKNK